MTDSSTEVRAAEEEEAEAETVKPFREAYE